MVKKSERKYALKGQKYSKGRVERLVSCQELAWCSGELGRVSPQGVLQRYGRGGWIQAASVGFSGGIGLRAGSRGCCSRSGRGLRVRGADHGCLSKLLESDLFTWMLHSMELPLAASLVGPLQTQLPTNQAESTHNMQCCYHPSSTQYPYYLSPTQISGLKLEPPDIALGPLPSMRGCQRLTLEA